MKHYASVYLDVQFTTGHNGMGNVVGFNKFSNIENITSKSFTASGTGETFIDYLTINKSGNYMISWMCQAYNTVNCAFAPYNLANDKYLSGPSFSLLSNQSIDAGQITSNIITFLNVGDMIGIYKVAPSDDI